MQKIAVRFMFVWSIVSVLLMLFLLWYVFDGRRGKTDQIQFESAQAPISGPAPTIANYQIELVGGDAAVNQIVEQVARHIYLPRGDVKVATIVDADGLRKDFPGVYTYAQNGQKAIFYPLGLIIFDPVSDRIVDVIRK